MLETTSPAHPGLSSDAGPRTWIALLATESLKLRTVRAPMALAGAGILLTAALAVQSVFGSGRSGAPSVGTAGLLLAVLSAASRAKLLALVVGVLVVTAERRHAGLTATLLQTPQRVRLMVSKTALAALVGLLMGLLTLAVSVLVAAGSGALRAPLVNGDVVLAAAGQLLGYPLYGLLGVGVGSLLMASQPIAVLLPLAWFLLLESYVGALVHRVAPWLPGQLTSALANSGELPSLPPVWAGCLGLLGYGVVLVTAGTARVARADVG